jgi:hypothetical protein
VFDWLFEGRLAVYLFLAVVAVILLGLWWRDRRRGWLFGVAAVGVLIGIYFLLDRLVETRSEQISRKLQEMAAGVKAGDTERIFLHVSDRFTFAGLNKAAFQAAVDRILQARRVTDLAIFDFQPLDERGRVFFRAKPIGDEQGLNIAYIVRAQFVRDPDGQWRLQSFEVFNPVVNTNTPMQVPQLR